MAPRRRSFANDAAALSVAAILAAVLAYGLLLVIVNGLGDDDAAPVVLIWSYWALATTALGAPVQQWILRNGVVGVEVRAERAVLARLSALIVLIAVLATMVSSLLDERLFGSSSWVFPFCIGATTLGAWTLGIARGRLAAAGRYYTLAASLPGENLIRLVAALVLVAGGADARGLALVVPGGYVIVFMLRAGARRSREEDSALARGGMLGSLTAIALISQTMFTSVPFVIALGDAPASTVTATFAVLAVARLPHLIASAMSSRILDSLTRIAIDTPRRLWTTRRLILLAVPPIAVASSLFGATVGREVVRWVFGLDEAVSQPSAAWVTVGAVVAVGALLLAMSGVAVGRPGPVIVSGLAGLAAGVVVVVVADAPEIRATLAFAVAEVVYFSGLGVAAVRERSRSDVRV